MRNFYAEDLIIFDSNSKLSAAFTAATTDIITSTAHGLKEGDLVQVASTTTLPAGLSVLTNYYVKYLTADTFKLSTVLGGTAVDITDTGTGTHSFYLKGKNILVTDARHIVISINTAGNANFNVKFKVSQQSDVDFNAAASATNRWKYVQNVDTEDGTPYNGNSGITFSGTDGGGEYVINRDAAMLITIDVSSWVAGTLMAKASIYD